MPVMTEEEAAKAAALEKLAAAETAVSEAEEAQLTLQRDAATAWDAWAADPTNEKKLARDLAQKRVGLGAKALEEVRIAHWRALVAAHGGRVEFPPTDEYAVLETRPTHQEYVKLLEATARLAEATLEKKFAVMSEYVAVLLREWRVLDRDGNPLERTVEGIAAAPYDRTRPIFERATAIFRSLPTPNL